MGRLYMFEGPKGFLPNGHPHQIKYEAVAEFGRHAGGPRGVIQAWVASKGCNPELGPAWTVRTRGGLDVLLLKAFSCRKRILPPNTRVDYLLVLRHGRAPGRRGLRDVRRMEVNALDLEAAEYLQDPALPDLAGMEVSETQLLEVFPPTDGYLVLPIDAPGDDEAAVVKACGDMVEALIGEVETAGRV